MLSGEVERDLDLVFSTGGSTGLEMRGDQVGGYTSFVSGASCRQLWPGVESSRVGGKRKHAQRTPLEDGLGLSLAALAGWRDHAREGSTRLVPASAYLCQFS